MKGGTIVLMGGAEMRTGAWMARGTIIALTPVTLLPTFSAACAYNPTFVNLYAKRLHELGFSIPYHPQDGAYLRYTGDSAVPGKGELLIWQPRNPA
jgi:formylmethanofuran dehydrogenase subunit C